MTKAKLSTRMKAATADIILLGLALFASPVAGRLGSIQVRSLDDDSCPCPLDGIWESQYGMKSSDSATTYAMKETWTFTNHGRLATVEILSSGTSEGATGSWCVGHFKALSSNNIFINPNDCYLQQWAYKIYDCDFQCNEGGENLMAPSCSYYSQAPVGFGAHFVGGSSGPQNADCNSITYFAMPHPEAMEQPSFRTLKRKTDVVLTSPPDQCGCTLDGTWSDAYETDSGASMTVETWTFSNQGQSINIKTFSSPNPMAMQNPIQPTSYDWCSGQLDLSAGFPELLSEDCSVDYHPLTLDSCQYGCSSPSGEDSLSSPSSISCESYVAALTGPTSPFKGVFSLDCQTFVYEVPSSDSAILPDGAFIPNLSYTSTTIRTLFRENPPPTTDCLLAGTWEATFHKKTNVMRHSNIHLGDLQYAETPYMTIYSLKFYTDGVAIMGESRTSAILPDIGDPLEFNALNGKCLSSWKLLSDTPVMSMGLGSAKSDWVLTLFDCTDPPACDSQGGRLGVESGCRDFNATIQITMTTSDQCNCFTLESSADFPQANYPLQFCRNDNEPPEATPLDFFESLGQQESDGEGNNDELGEVVDPGGSSSPPCICNLPGQWKIETNVVHTQLSISATTTWDIFSDGMNGSGEIDMAVAISIPGIAQSASCSGSFLTRSSTPLEISQNDCSVSTVMDVYACTLHCPGADELLEMISCNQYASPGTFRVTPDCQCLDLDEPTSLPGMEVTMSACRTDTPIQDPPDSVPELIDDATPFPTTSEDIEAYLNNLFDSILAKRKQELGKAVGEVFLRVEEDLGTLIDWSKTPAQEAVQDQILSDIATDLTTEQELDAILDGDGDAYEDLLQRIEKKMSELEQDISDLSEGYGPINCEECGEIAEKREKMEMASDALDAVVCALPVAGSVCSAFTELENGEKKFDKVTQSVLSCADKKFCMCRGEKQCSHKEKLVEAQREIDDGVAEAFGNYAWHMGKAVAEAVGYAVGGTVAVAAKGVKKAMDATEHIIAVFDGKTDHKDVKLMTDDFKEQYTRNKKLKGKNKGVLDWVYNLIVNRQVVKDTFDYILSGDEKGKGKRWLAYQHRSLSFAAPAITQDSLLFFISDIPAAGNHVRHLQVTLGDVHPEAILEVVAPSHPTGLPRCLDVWVSSADPALQREPNALLYSMSAYKSNTIIAHDVASSHDRLPLLMGQSSFSELCIQGHMSIQLFFQPLDFVGNTTPSETFNISLNIRDEGSFGSLKMKYLRDNQAFIRAAVKQQNNFTTQYQFQNLSLSMQQYLQPHIDEWEPNKTANSTTFLDPDAGNYTNYTRTLLQQKQILSSIKEIPTSRTTPFPSPTCDSTKFKNIKSIPKTIIQTAKSKNDLNRSDWSKYHSSLKEHNPNYTFLVYDDTGIQQFINTHFQNTSLPDVIRKLPRSVMKADIFRLAVVSVLGGFYMDMDMLAKGSFDPIVDSGCGAVFPKEWWKGDDAFMERHFTLPTDGEDHWQVGNYAFAAVPNHPLLIDSLDEAVKRTIDLVSNKSADDVTDLDVLRTTGPYMLSEVYHDGRKAGKYKDVLHINGDSSKPIKKDQEYGFDWHKFGPYAEHMLSHTWVQVEEESQVNSQ